MPVLKQQSKLSVQKNAHSNLNSFHDSFFDSHSATFWKLYANNLIANQLGCPKIHLPFNSRGPVCLALAALFGDHLPRLPRVLRDRIKTVVRGWAFNDKFATHARRGKVFAVVTPAQNDIWVADPELVHVTLSRRKDFPQDALPAMTSFLGRNILTVSLPF